MGLFSENLARPVLTALAVMMVGTALPAAAQTDRHDLRGGERWNPEEFWRGAPTGLRERIDWLQQRIDRGIADGSIDRREARQAQWELDQLKRDAMALDQRLDDVSRKIRWYRRSDSYGYGDQDHRDPYAIEYDASRYYRANPRYHERRLGSDDEIYRGSDGRYYCRRSDGTVGMVVGAIGGATIGNVIDSGRNRVAGTLIGGALGALIGKSIDENNSDLRCR